MRKDTREEHNAGLVALGLMDIEPTLLQINVLDPEVERLAHSQATGIDQVNDQAGRVSVSVGDMRQQLQHFVTSWTMR